MALLDDLKALREETGMSVMDCKKALAEGGTMEKARELLRARGAVIAGKKHDRETGEGIIEAYIHTTGKTGVLLDMRSETDFVAKSADFKTLAHEIALQIASMNPETVEELLSQDCARDPAKKVRNLLEEYIAKLGENIVVKNFTRYHI
ncbi:MAG: translation elongation factor Ts [Candidatus Wildermuthbacteria bacterium]|nr:translation elongation factor Ts [Candidatus Wildermuthbacteria bacterium]